MFTETRLAAEKLLRDPSAAETQVRTALRQLESPDLLHDDFAWAVVNLSLALGFSTPVSVVRQYAIEVVRSGLFRSWEAYAFLGSLEKLAQGDPGPPPAAPIAGLSADVLRSLSNARVLCAQHIGMFRFIPFALAASGFKVNVLGQGSGFERLKKAIEAARSSTAGNGEAHEHLRALHALELFDPTKPGVIVRLIKKLRSGELAVIYIDGNLGARGAFDTASTEEVAFAGTNCLVKNGAARIASLANVPVLPVCALACEHGRATLECGEPIFSARSNSCSSGPIHREMMQAIYGYFEAKVLEAPEQWESSRFIHRIRRPSRQHGVFNHALTDPQLNEAHLFLGTAQEIRLRPGKLMPLEMPGGRFWIDLAAMKLYQHEHLDAMLLPLSGPGLNSQDLAKLLRDPARGKFYLRCLAQLQSNDMIVLG